MFSKILTAHQPANAAHAQLVARVKAVQRSDGGKEMWENFIMNQGGGKKDPMIRTTECLMAFLSEADPGNTTANAMPAPKPTMKPALQQSFVMPAMPVMMQPQMAFGQDRVELANRVKALQRMEGGRELWSAFIDKKGGGKRDPMARTTADLEEFIEEADPEGRTGPSLQVQRPFQPIQHIRPLRPMQPMQPIQIMQHIQPSPVQQHSVMEPAASKFTAESPEHAYAIARVKAIQKMEGGKELWHAFCDRSGGKKDPASRSVNEIDDFLAEADPEGKTVDVESSFSELEALIGRVKKGQRLSDEFKEAWYQHCSDSGNNKRDPRHHSADSLETFLDSAPDVEEVEPTPSHQALVREIKTGQRESTEFKEAWWNFCQENGGGKNDPTRHDEDFLQNFLFSVKKAAQGKGGKAKSKGSAFRFSPY